MENVVHGDGVKMEKRRWNINDDNDDDDSNDKKL